MGIEWLLAAADANRQERTELDSVHVPSPGAVSRSMGAGECQAAGPKILPVDQSTVASFCQF
jgi:hypothetical protein